MEGGGGRVSPAEPLQNFILNQRFKWEQQAAYQAFHCAVDMLNSNAFWYTRLW